MIPADSGGAVVRLYTPALAATGATLGANAGGSFYVSPEEAPQAIADLREAARQMRVLMAEAAELADVKEPGKDEVSIAAVQLIGEKATEKDGALRKALGEGAAELEKAADQLEADLKNYLQVEELNIPTAREL